MDILRFIFPTPSDETDPEKGIAFFTLEAASKVLEALRRRPEGQEYDLHACRRLLEWLRSYELANATEPRFKGLWPCEGIFAQAECKPIPSE